MADYNSDRTGSNIDLTLDKVDALDAKVQPTSTGVDVTGTVTADGLTVDGDITLTAGDKLKFNDDRYFTPENNVDGAEVSANGNFTVKTGTTPNKSLVVGANGDVSFFEDTGTTAKFHWDSSAESLGIGGSPNYTLDVRGRAGFGLPNTTLPTLGEDTANFRIGNLSGTTINYGTMFGTLGSGDGYIQQQRFDGNATAYDLLLQPNGGNVGIGTDSPSGDLVVSNGGAGGVEFTASYSGTRNLLLNYNRSSPSYTGLDFDATDYIFYGSGSERARIDSSGNLLVGTTDADLGYTDGDTGLVSDPSGFLQIARDSSLGYPLLYLNRLNHDGKHIEFWKDGSPLGSIGNLSTSLYIGGNSQCGVMFNGANYNPTSSGGTRSDATVTLGQSNYRYKDLYLSGGVYLGGTGAANKLDDYETGDWTPTANSNITVNSILNADYVKVGNVVTVNAWIKVNITAGSFILSGLPYTITGRATSTLNNVTQRETIVNQALGSSLYGYEATTTGTDDDMYISFSYVTS